jgi:hypothetical protein
MYTQLKKSPVLSKIAKMQKVPDTKLKLCNILASLVVAPVASLPDLHYRLANSWSINS